MMGFLNINKPKEMTSFDVIAILRKISKIRQIGHGGTLDPLATGVLPIAIGNATRLLEYLPQNKAYVATACFGKVSNTYDSEGVVVDFSDKKVSKDELTERLKIFDGEILQTPPMYSAVHYKGKRLYELARKGEIVEDLPKRKVNVHKIELINFDYENQSAEIEIHCSSGTYIRSIIHDLGQNLNTGAIMTDLTRILSADMELKHSVSLEELKTFEDVKDKLLNPICIFQKNTVILDENGYKKVLNGQSINIENSQENDGITFLIYEDRISAIAEKNGDYYKIKKVFKDF